MRIKDRPTRTQYHQRRHDPQNRNQHGQRYQYQRNIAKSLDHPIPEVPRRRIVGPLRPDHPATRLRIRIRTFDSRCPRLGRLIFSLHPNPVSVHSCVRSLPLRYTRAYGLPAIHCSAAFLPASPARLHSARQTSAPRLPFCPVFHVSLLFELFVPNSTRQENVARLFITYSVYLVKTFFRAVKSKNSPSIRSTLKPFSYNFRIRPVKAKLIECRL